MTEYKCLRMRLQVQIIIILVLILFLNFQDQFELFQLEIHELPLWEEKFYYVAYFCFF